MKTMSVIYSASTSRNTLKPFTILLVSWCVTVIGSKAMEISGADMVTRCWTEAAYSMEVALGDFINYSAMCSKGYFHECNATLPYVFLNTAQMQPYQSAFIMSTLLSWVNGGGKYLCNMGFYNIEHIMDYGGRLCIKDYAAAEVGECNKKMASLWTSYPYLENYCRHLHNSLQCYINAVHKCENRKLTDFLLNFFRSVTWSSSCRETIRLTSSASSIVSNVYLLVLTISAVLALGNTY